MSPARRSAKKSPARAARRRAAGPAVAEAHLPSDGELRRLAERVLQISRCRRNRSAYRLRGGRADALRQQYHPPKCRRAGHERFRAHRLRRSHRARHDEQDRRRFAAPRGGRVGGAGAQPAEKSGLAADAWPAEICQGRALFPRDRRRHAAGPCGGGRASDRARGAKSADRRRHLFYRRFGGGHGQFQGTLRQLSPVAGRIFRHHYGAGLLGLGQGQCTRQLAKSIRKRWPSAPAKRPQPRDIRRRSSPAAGR